MAPVASALCPVRADSAPRYSCVGSSCGRASTRPNPRARPLPSNGRSAGRPWRRAASARSSSNTAASTSTQAAICGKPASHESAVNTAASARWRQLSRAAACSRAHRIQGSHTSAPTTGKACSRAVTQAEPMKAMPPTKQASRERPTTPSHAAMPPPARIRCSQASSANPLVPSASGIQAGG